MNAQPYINEPAITKETLRNNDIVVQDDVVYSFEEGFDPEQLCPFCGEKLGRCVSQRIKIVRTSQTAIIHRGSCATALFYS
ncbi:MAG: hypothetical protein A2849_00585 [Candidatus Taylorbacteria bacterium RIFCSPHIGHO2_01_FULL_51_15]|uniref:Uncharacterized protein n=1 Tax=Candidatus Taylorbacteria bacterium RIFCSPHIGHO2_01_FULL_51_15 TaxID=1802304 RepID=A0A1G2MBF5_9BACT|nr:MAG: hypothetical protein A2849_00585 [Candidatus Taylorbacteria bacterium RIFCSPHIGHO2_01_FULL_51_15]